MPAVEVKNATKRFGRVRAISSINFSSSKGINIILGPNGAGKSTLLRCMSGLYRPDSGSVRVLGSDPYADDSLRYRISLLADSYDLYDYLSVADNLKFFGRLYSLKDKETMTRARGILKELDALGYMGYRVNALSRGTKQKIAFCRAMLNDPDVLLLDEPTAFLDINASARIRGFAVDAARQGSTIVLVTQKLDEITRFNAKLFVMRRGKIVKTTTTDSLYFLNNSMIRIKLARPLPGRVMEGIGNLVKAGEDNTLLTLRVKSYKHVNREIQLMMSRGAYVIGIDYIEPFAEEKFGGG